MQKSVTDLLLEFHKTYGCSIGDTDLSLEYERISFVPNPLLDLREKLIDEEYKEVKEAIKGSSRDSLLKELADLVYVVVGTAVAMGMDFDGAFAEVHRSNMSKLGDDGKPIYNEFGKVLKGQNYSPADMSRFV